MSQSAHDVDQIAVNAIRTLSMDAVQAAASGHPGTPMALAPVAYQLWTNVLTYDPTAPQWPNRDRYVLSCGHASMLLYSLLHLAQVRKIDGHGLPTDQLAVTLADLKAFRQWGSATPGHPEFGHTSGVETTTGPLGQGCGNSVGMAMASKWLAARYNRPGFELFNYRVFVQCSDGDLMEGVACEAASLAGHLKLDNLCWIYDDNQITIEGKTELAFSEDVAARFRGLGWNVHIVWDANDLTALGKAFDAALIGSNAPTLVVVKSVIGYGAPNKAGTAAAHGEPLGAEEIRLAKEAYGWPAESFYVPAEAITRFATTMGNRGAAKRKAWERLAEDYAAKYPVEAAELKAMGRRSLPEQWDAAPVEFPADAGGIATRIASGKALNSFAAKIPWLLGGSADLAPSTKTLLTFGGAGDLSASEPGGRNLHFGIREHAMAAACNGLALCGLRPFAATFFVFSDYLRPSMRLSALMGLPVVYVFTHDSIGVGEDGPTHQPVEQLAAARSIPGLVVLRPGDANETVHAWKAALAETHRPTALVLTRQNLPTVDREKLAPASRVAQGAYILSEAASGKPQVLLMASGSEVSLALAAQSQLAAKGVPTRVVSIPSFELFEDQSPAYHEEVLPAKITARVAVEAGVRQGWDRYLGSHGAFVGMQGFGASAPFTTLFQQMGITVDAVVAAAQRLIQH